MPETDGRREIYLGWLEALTADESSFTPASRDQLRVIRRDTAFGIDAMWQSLRRFRNLLLVLVLTLAALLAGLGLAHAADSQFIPICTSAELSPGHVPTCSMEHSLLFQLELLGALGGFLAALLPVARGGGIAGRFALPGLQIGLKIVSGAATGALGVLLVSSGFIPGLTVDNAARAGYAILFGFGQQGFTRLLDERARLLVTSPSSSVAPELVPEPPQPHA